MFDVVPLSVLGSVAFAAAGIAAAGLSFAIVKLGWKLRLLHYPGPGRIHRTPVVRFGGFAILPAALFALLLTSQDPKSLVGISICAVAIAAVGLTDDLFDIPALAKLSGQFAVAIAALLIGVQINVVSNPFGGVIELNTVVGSLITVLWLVGMMNAINLLDGLDGLAPGVVLVSALIMALLSAQLGNPALVLFGLALAGSVAGFLPFNAYKARLILGDSGSNLLGFLIGTLAVLGQAKIGTALLVLGIPILDVAWTIVRRKRSGRGITTRDTGHLHHRLVDAGLTRPQVTVIYVFLCTAFGASALLLDRAEKLLALVALTALTACLLYVSARKISRKRH